MMHFCKTLHAFLVYPIILVNLTILFGCSVDNSLKEGNTTYFDISIKVEGQGKVTPETGLYFKNSLILFKATALSGYYFDRWIGFDEEIDIDQYSFFLNRNLTLTAVFLPIPDLTDEVLVFNPKEIDPNPVFMIENGGKSAYLTSKTGEKLKTWNFDSKLGNDIELMPDGGVIGIFKPESVSFSFGGYGGILKRFDSDGSLLWQFEVNNDTELMHHDFEILPNGNILILIWEKFTSDEALNMGFAGDGPIYLEKLVEFIPETKDIVWEWSSADHLIQDYESSAENFGVVAKHPERINLNYSNQDNGDLMHANGLTYDPKRDVVFLSVNFYSEVWVIPHQFDTQESKTELGNLIYRFGNPLAFNGEEERLFYNNHHPSLINLNASSLDNFLIYMNGSMSHQSKVFEFILPAVFDSVPLNWFNPKINWTFTDPDLFSAKISGAYRLPNGNTLICEGDFGYWEVNSSGSIVWKFDGDTTYWRGYVYPEFTQ